MCVGEGGGSPSAFHPASPGPSVERPSQCATGCAMDCHGLMGCHGLPPTELQSTLTAQRPTAQICSPRPSCALQSLMVKHFEASSPFHPARSATYTPTPREDGGGGGEGERKASLFRALRTSPSSRGAARPCRGDRTPALPFPSPPARRPRETIPLYRDELGDASRLEQTDECLLNVQYYASGGGDRVSNPTDDV